MPASAPDRGWKSHDTKAPTPRAWRCGSCPAPRVRPRSPRPLPGRLRQDGGARLAELDRDRRKRDPRDAGVREDGDRSLREGLPQRHPRCEVARADDGEEPETGPELAAKPLGHAALALGRDRADPVEQDEPIEAGCTAEPGDQREVARRDPAVAGEELRV